MKINKFKNNEFGTLTTITNEETGVITFIASEIGKIWGHTNLKQVINRVLNKEEYEVILKSKYPEIFNALIKEKIISNMAQKLQVITINGMVKLVMNTDKLVQKMAFMSWLKEIGIIDTDMAFLKQRNEIEFSSLLIPFLEYHGYKVSTQYKIDKFRLDFFIDELKLCIEFDEQHHKYTKKRDDDRSLFLESQGIKTIRIPNNINYGRVFAFLNYVINFKPENRCAMNLTYDLVISGLNLKDASELSFKHGVLLFEEMIKIGASPKELE